jgi:diguanylate cyclase (GGDEF)-like protein
MVSPTMQTKFIKRYVIILGVVWSLAIVVVLFSHFKDDRQHTIDRVLIRAESLLERDILYRDWSAGHGGVYVPVSEKSPPNPHLEFLPGRDVESVDGRQLTLVNPSYMTHQAFKLSNDAGGSLSKITSLKVLNPANAPDEWERQSLLKFEQGVDSVSGVVSIQGVQFVRTMRPFFVEEKCIKCHAAQGYKLGEIRGGISIAIPLRPALETAWHHNVTTVGLFALLWIIGLCGLALLGYRLKCQSTLALESDQRRDQAEMNLHFLSNFDRRTNLPNRFMFDKHLQDSFQRVASQGGQVAVAAFELLNFKQIVDTFDHPTGDALLKIMAERLATLLPMEESIARFGEDRLLFSLTLQDGQSVVPTVEEILKQVNRPITLENQEFFPLGCFGVAFYPSDASDEKRLVQKAVSALTFSLGEGKSGIELFSHSLQVQARSRLNIESGLRRALAGNEFELYLQPQINAASGEVTGAEALLRWNDAEQGFIPPDRFIPIAEENGLILPIGEWVLRTAADLAIKVKEQLGRPLRIGVNVSAKQFHDPALVDIVDQLLASPGMSPDLFEIEITEGTFIEDIDYTIELLTDLKVRGLKIAIDDFGTGYSSLSYLKRFPIDRLKVDRSFVMDIAENDDDRVIVGLITGMARKLGLEVIAEGVEDEVQKNLLIGMGCDDMQGYLYSKALPVEEFITFVADFEGR